MRLLVVEDSAILCNDIVLGLRKDGYAVDIVPDVKQGLWAATEIDYDLLIVYSLSPGEPGLELIRDVRRKKRSAAILVLTRLGAVENRVRALDLGADDYLVKPIDFDELLARIRVLLRRRYAQPTSAIAIRGLMIDTTAKRVQRDGVDVVLRPREYVLLEYLAFRCGEVVSVRDIEEHLYDDGAELSSNTIESSISMLRKAIDLPGCASLIHTRRGLGYMLAQQC